MAQSADTIPFSEGTANPLADLLVFDCLEVGPVRIEPNRLIAPYRLVRGDQVETQDLIYRFEEAVFTPGEPESLNLASMMAAQVALNYGLFCRNLVFHGVFDEADRRFLKRMAENTAREIYVKKFLEPNPFLVGAARGLQPVKLRSYLQAELVFSEGQAGKKGVRWQLWPTDKRRHCILSSGGKDSLLSFGLLAEILQPENPNGDVNGILTGGEVHPIFVNESGRHWFTAINAYRHFKAQVPGTARVWVNSDRIFAWMLRRMPFIRPNFEDVRADEYPIRLWTVAVFLFGVLPLMRKRRIGRLLIGDEFDTTRRLAYQGIAHYDGLFDQSIYFDNALSGYFMRKGWSISQFSVLRPMSELLIQRILAERYPQLQAHQVSCHAAHKAEDRIVPCGKCEKCRRIVGMLTACGKDPRHCGYDNEQIADCLAALARREVHQEAAGAQQMRYMLQQRGLLQHGAMPPSSTKMQPCPEVLQLRFDPERSPVEGIPPDLRRPLYRLLLRYAGGTLRRIGRKWEPFDLFDDPALLRPYPFEMEPVAPTDRSIASDAQFEGQRFLWAEMSWPQVKAYLSGVDIALLPVGAIEQHGPHLPVDTDAFDAAYLARRVAEACSLPRPLVLPLLPYGVSYHHHDFKGTLSISNETLSRLTYEIGMSAAKNGIQKLVIINGHGGNAPALNFAAQMINRDAKIFVCVDTGETSDVDIDDLTETPNDVHAGEIETSTSLAVRPQLVDMEKAEANIPLFSSRYLDFTSKRGVSWYAYTRKISASGVMGDPTKASAAKGQKIWEIMVAHLVGMVEDLKGMTLEEIHHRRY